MTPGKADTRLRVAVIIGSTREGRMGRTISTWFVHQAEPRDDLDLAVIDLAEFEFPQRYPHDPTPAMTAFAARVRRAEAFVVVTPEYNRSFPASLKQAIDLVYDEWRAKPVGFVSYGLGSDGVYAVEQLRVVFTELHTVTMRNCVGLDLMACAFDDGGMPLEDDGRRQAATTMLDQLTWWGRALRDARAARPYVS
jgi:NAD(P)H-dependent FMN reductase